MKTKKIVSLCLTAAMTLSMAAVSAENNNSVTVNINGKAVDFSKYDNVMPYIENDITLIPIRAIAEGLGCEVSWDGENQTVEIKGLNDEILLTINSSTAAEALIAMGYDANMIRFEKGTVLKDGEGMEHNASFNYGYKIPAVRDWLFEQSK